MELKQYIGKNVEVFIYRKRHKTPDHYKRVCGVLVNYNTTSICLKNGSKRRWYPRPRYYKDSIKILKENNNVTNRR